MFDKLKIGIGDIKNPMLFSVDERIKMIKDNFPDAKISFFLLEDLDLEHKYANQWGKYVEEVVGKFDFVAAVEDSYDDYIRKDFLKIGYPIVVFPRFNSISGTNIRKLITDQNKNWVTFLTKETQKVITESNFYKSTLT